jgi:hypothetical protein
VRLGSIRSIEKSNTHIGNRTRRLPACSTVPQPTALPRALHNEELHNVYASLDIIRIIKSRKMIYVVHIACTERSPYKGVVGKPEEKRPLERPMRIMR